jgi:hypothetical protein
VVNSVPSSVQRYPRRNNYELNFFSFQKEKRNKKISRWSSFHRMNNFYFTPFKIKRFCFNLIESPFRLGNKCFVGWALGFKKARRMIWWDLTKIKIKSQQAAKCTQQNEKLKSTTYIKNEMKYKSKTFQRLCWNPWQNLWNSFKTKFNPSAVFTDYFSFAGLEILANLLLQ